MSDKPDHFVPIQHGEQPTKSPTVREATKFVGQKTLAAMKQTKWFAFAQILEEALYLGRIEDKGLPGTTINCTDIPGVNENGEVTDLRRALRDLINSCEEMALLDVTQ